MTPNEIAPAVGVDLNKEGLSNRNPVFLRLGLQCPEIAVSERHLRNTPTDTPTRFAIKTGFRRIYLDYPPAKNPDTAKDLDEPDPLKTLEQRRGCPLQADPDGLYWNLSSS